MPDLGFNLEAETRKSSALKSNAMGHSSKVLGALLLWGTGTTKKYPVYFISAFSEVQRLAR